LSNIETQNKDISHRKKLIILTSAALIITLAIGGIFLYKKNGFGKTAPNNIEAATEAKKLVYLYMPNLIGHSEEGAVKKLEEVGFYNIKVEYETAPSGLVGTVTRQSIPENATVGTDYEIIIFIGK
jgi:dihydropteroate synthase